MLTTHGKTGLTFLTFRIFIKLIKIYNKKFQKCLKKQCQCKRILHARIGYSNQYHSSSLESKNIVDQVFQAANCAILSMKIVISVLFKLQKVRHFRRLEFRYTIYRQKDYLLTRTTMQPCLITMIFEGAAAKAVLKIYQSIYRNILRVKTKKSNKSEVSY